MLRIFTNSIQTNWSSAYLQDNNSNILFDQDKVIEEWYSLEDDLINRNYYPYNQAIEVDTSTLIILNAIYDSPNYMLNQKNIWTITRFEDNELLMRVFNDQVFYVFEETGTYNITAEAYDYYGNLKTKIYEGLLKVTDPAERREINLILCGAEFPAEFPAAFDCDFT